MVGERFLRSRRNALSIGALAVLLSGCGTEAPIGVPGAIPERRAIAVHPSTSNYRVVYSFGSVPDGQQPEAGLIDVGGTLYGTTSAGGLYPCNTGAYNGCGTVFSVTPDGTEKVLHSFGYGTDGRNPLASLIEVKGKLYGTTYQGGSNGNCDFYYSGCGTVFVITPVGKERVLHNFAASPDGAQPEASLIDVKGTLYGTTTGGGGVASYCGGTGYYRLCGSVFSITTNGTEKVLHGFGKGTDGYSPEARLVNVRGLLYGTTVFGGEYDRGTVFSSSLSGGEKVLHNFGKGTDGAYPNAGLINVGGMLYGTTEFGGEYDRSSGGAGTVFSVTPSGKETVLHSFGNGADGSHPVASLIEINGTLYGTTRGGGGDGTIFSITPQGVEKVLHSFGGTEPDAPLIDVAGTLYGTTLNGGAYSHGTVFALSP